MVYRSLKQAVVEMFGKRIGDAFRHVSFKRGFRSLGFSKEVEVLGMGFLETR